MVYWLAIVVVAIIVSFNIKRKQLDSFFNIEIIKVNIKSVYIIIVAKTKKKKKKTKITKLNQSLNTPSYIYLLYVLGLILFK